MKEKAAPKQRMAQAALGRRQRRHQKASELYKGVRNVSYDAARQRRLKTVELIVEEVPWHSERTARKGAEMVGVRVECREVSLQQQVKLAGGRWNPARRVWELGRDQALKLGLKDRIEHAEASISGNY